MAQGPQIPDTSLTLCSRYMARMRPMPKHAASVVHCCCGFRRTEQLTTLTKLSLIRRDGRPALHPCARTPTMVLGGTSEGMGRGFAAVRGHGIVDRVSAYVRAPYPDVLLYRPVRYLSHTTGTRVGDDLRAAPLPHDRRKLLDRRVDVSGSMVRRPILSSVLVSCKRHRHDQLHDRARASTTSWATSSCQTDQHPPS
jgi:hypothetical protein